MTYERKHFNPEASGDSSKDVEGNIAFHRAGTAAEDLYVFAPKVVLALNVALATGRPLLVSGEPGCGKSTLARSAAAVLDWPFYGRTVTSRTQAADLLWTFDAVRRLNDAYTPNTRLPSNQHYVEPGPLWWAFAPKTAAQRGCDPIEARVHARDPRVGGTNVSEAAVVLIDEIDKADPDVPNDLLEPFDRRSFTVHETQQQIEAQRRVLMVLTTNRERTLPRAFLRRCVTLDLDAPTAAWLESIAVKRYGAQGKAIFSDIAKELMALRNEAHKAGVREPSTAEYLDAVNAVIDLKVNRPSEDWRRIKQALLWKSDAPLPERTAEQSQP